MLLACQICKALEAYNLKNDKACTQHNINAYRHFKRTFNNIVRTPRLTAGTSLPVSGLDNVKLEDSFSLRETCLLYHLAVYVFVNILLKCLSNKLKELF